MITKWTKWKLHPTRHKIDHFGDIPPSQPLDIVLKKTRMWASDQRDGRPAEYRWRSLFNGAKSAGRSLLVLRSNAAKTWNPLKFAGVPQTPEPISAVSGPKVTILRGHVEEVLLFSTFFRLSMCLSCKDIGQRSHAMVRRWRIFLHPVFSASCMQQVSDFHPKFALRPNHVWKYSRDAICGDWRLRLPPPHHNHFMALFPGLPGWAGARRETSGLHGARED